MKQQIRKLVSAIVLMFSPAFAVAQRVQPVPDAVTEVRLDGHQQLRVIAGDENNLETDSDRKNIAVLRGGRLAVKASDDVVTLRLAPGRSISIHAEDYASVVVEGALPLRDLLSVEAEDYATVNFAGSDADTVRCLTLRLQTEDFSRITSSSILQHFEYDLSASDYSRIQLAGVDQMPNPTDSSYYLSTSISNFGKVYLGRVTAHGELLQTDFPKDDRDYTTVVNGMTNRLANMARNGSSDSKKSKKTSTWFSGNGDLDFGWGWHNWGPSVFSGFGGVDGAANVSTSFNNIHLAGKWQLIGNWWFGLYAGVGLEWDKWKFTTPNVELNTAAAPYAFAEAAPAAGSTLLTTRYVNIPLAIRLGDDDGVHLMLTALPGIHWNASGLRHTQHDGNRQSTVKDRSVNRHINPYKLDLRAELRFNVVGIYVQVSTLSLFRNDAEPLYPVKFGIIL